MRHQRENTEGVESTKAKKQKCKTRTIAQVIMLPGFVKFGFANKTGKVALAYCTDHFKTSRKSKS